MTVDLVLLLVILATIGVVGFELGARAFGVVALTAAVVLFLLALTGSLSLT